MDPTETETRFKIQAPPSRGLQRRRTQKLISVLMVEHYHIINIVRTILASSPNIMDPAELLSELEEDPQVVRDSDERCLALAAQAEAAARYAAQHLDERCVVHTSLSCHTLMPR